MIWKQPYFKSHSHSALAIVVYSLCISTLYLLLVPKEYNFISGDYYTSLNNIIHGHSLITENGIILDRYPPVIPYLFSAFFKLSIVFHATPQLFYIIYSVFAISLATVLVYKIAVLFLSQPVSILASILFSLCPFIQFGVIRVASEPTYILLFYAAMYFLLNAYINRLYSPFLFIAIGALLGFTMLTRPAGILFPLLFALFILLTFSLPLAKRLVLAGLLLLSSLLVIAPWEIPVSHQEGYLVPLSIGGPISIWDGLRFNNCAYRQTLHLSPQAERLSDTITTHLRDFKSNTSPFLKQQFRHAPVAFLQLIGLKILRSWYAVESQNKHQEVFNLVLMGAYLILAVIGVFSFLKTTTKKKSNICLFFFCIILYSWAMTTLVLSILRYMSPILGFVIIFSAEGIHVLYKRKNSNHPLFFKK